MSEYYEYDYDNYSDAVPIEKIIHILVEIKEELKKRELKEKKVIESKSKYDNDHCLNFTNDIVHINHMFRRNGNDHYEKLVND
jgi:hypothetical protein